MTHRRRSQRINHILDRRVEAVRPRDFFSKVFLLKIENLRKFDSFYKKVGKRHKNHSKGPISVVEIDLFND